MHLSCSRKEDFLRDGTLFSQEFNVKFTSGSQLLERDSHNNGFFLVTGNTIILFLAS